MQPPNIEKKVPPNIDLAAARAFIEVASKDGFGETIQLIFDTLKLETSADIAVGALQDRLVNGPPGDITNNFRAALSIAFAAGMFYAEQARKAHEERGNLPEIVQ